MQEIVECYRCKLLLEVNILPPMCRSLEMNREFVAIGGIEIWYEMKLAVSVLVIWMMTCFLFSSCLVVKGSV